MLLHGAAKIMQQKTDRLDFTHEIDIDALIKDGIDKHRALQEQAEK